jgi:PAS domain-containing protein
MEDDLGDPDELEPGLEWRKGIRPENIITVPATDLSGSEAELIETYSLKVPGREHPSERCPMNRAGGCLHAELTPRPCPICRVGPNARELAAQRRAERMLAAHREELERRRVDAEVWREKEAKRKRAERKERDARRQKERSARDKKKASREAKRRNRR